MSLSKGKIKYLVQEFQGNQIKLVTEKGHYPYDYMNS